VTNDPQRHQNGPRRKNGGVRASFWEALGLPEPRYAPCDDPPEVDEDELRLLVRRYLSDERTEEVLRLVYTYKNWREAYDRILVEEVS